MPSENFIKFFKKHYSIPILLTEGLIISILVVQWIFANLEAIRNVFATIFLLGIFSEISKLDNAFGGTASK